MAEQKPDTPGDSGKEPPRSEQQEFTPVGSMVLLVIYILAFAAAWSWVYFGVLLARR